MLCYKRTQRALVLSAILFCTVAVAAFFAVAALGEESSGVLASFTGTLSSPQQEDHIALKSMPIRLSLVQVLTGKSGFSLHGLSRFLQS